MARRSGTRLTGKETQFVKGLAAGLPQDEAARRAGYSEQTAHKVAYQVLQRPLVRSAFTDALQRAGITWDQIVKPVKDALEATIHLEDLRRQRLIDTGVPDLKVRQQAHDRAVALYGGIPKVGEAVPTAHGLNLFIGLAVQTSARPAPATPHVVNGPAAKPANGGGGGHSTPAPRQPLTPPPSAGPTGVSIAVTVADAPGNRQAPKSNGGKPNGTG